MCHSLCVCVCVYCCVQVDEASFWTLHDEDLAELGISSAEDREQILTLISQHSTGEMCVREGGREGKIGERGRGEGEKRKFLTQMHTHVHICAGNYNPHTFRVHSLIVNQEMFLSVISRTVRCPCPHPTAWNAKDTLQSTYRLTCYTMCCFFQLHHTPPRCMPLHVCSHVVLLVTVCLQEWTNSSSNERHLWWLVFVWTHVDALVLFLYSCICVYMLFVGNDCLFSVYLSI